MSRDLDEPSDAELWRRAADEPAAFSALFQRHSDAVYNHCFRRTASWSAADDLRSAVFLEAWRRRRDVRLHDESLLPWLLAVANNVVRSRSRSIRRHRQMLERLPANVMALDDPEDEVLSRIADEEQMRLVLRAIEQLNTGEQDVLALCVWAKLDYASAAVALGVPVGTVRSRLSRARAHLREASADAQPRSLPLTVETPSARS